MGVASGPGKFSWKVGNYEYPPLIATELAHKLASFQGLFALSIHCINFFCVVILAISSLNYITIQFIVTTSVSLLLCVCMWQIDAMKVCIQLHPTHRPRPLSSHLALSADFTKMSLSSPVHTHVHAVLLTALKTYSVSYFLILMTIF